MNKHKLLRWFLPFLHSFWFGGLFGAKILNPLKKSVYTTKLMRLTQFLKRCVSAAVVELHPEGSVRSLQSRLIIVCICIEFVIVYVIKFIFLLDIYLDFYIYFVCIYIRICALVCNCIGNA